MSESEEAFVPYTPDSESPKEFSAKAIILGLILGFFFAVGNAYLALKIGTTISASIPAAIISMAILRLFFKNVTVLENNIVQTISTVGEGLAAGVVFTIPALIFLDAAPSISHIFLLSALGGILGILFMIPMRRYIIVKEHGVLPFPEGKACAEILIASQQGKSSAITALWGVIIGAAYKVCSNAIYIWQETFSYTSDLLRKATFSIDATPALLGVGYIIGPRIASLMFSGGALAWWVIIPLIEMFGTSIDPIYPSKLPISQMTPNDIWSNYVRYIGAGAVAIGGLVSLLRIIPLLHKTIHVGLKELFGKNEHRKNLPRTDRDVSMAFLILGSLAIILFLWLYPDIPLNLFTIILLIILAFFFAAVTSITVGLVGSSSNPVSGMTITTLLITCIIFVLLGWTERMYLISAITMSCVANIAICMSGTTSQDLKAGYLLGATPKSQQIAEIIGVLIPSLALGSTIFILNQAYHIGSAAMPAPQATLIALIAEGVISGNLPYTLVAIGVLLGLFVQLLRVPILPFAIGLYLPLSLSTATMVGALIALWVNSSNPTDSTKQKGILLCSGLIGGDACIGIIIALCTVLGIIPATARALLPSYTTLIAIILLSLGIGWIVLRKGKDSDAPLP